jgi:hypothetical protein
MKFVKFIVGASVGMALASPLALAEGSAKQVAQSMAGKTPATANGPVVLTVSGENGWYRVTYDNGEMQVPPSLFELGEVLPDGQYTYEYRSAAPAVTPASRGNQLGRRSEQRSSQLAWGSFEVKGGALVAN